MVDDGERVSDLIAVLGALFLHALHYLDNYKEVTPADKLPGWLDPPEKEGPIQNLGLVIGNMCGLADAYEGVTGPGEPCTAWKKEILELAEQKGIKVKTVTRELVDYGQKADDIEVDEEDSDEEGMGWDFMERVSLWWCYRW